MSPALAPGDALVLNELGLSALEPGQLFRLTEKPDPTYDMGFDAGIAHVKGSWLGPDDVCLALGFNRDEDPSSVLVMVNDRVGWVSIEFMCRLGERPLETPPTYLHEDQAREAAMGVGEGPG